MNRPEKQMALEDAKALLRKGTYGVLSLVQPDGAPYGIPLNYVYVQEEEALFFHCAPAGLKIDCMRGEPRACFTVVGRADIDVPRFTTHYASVIVSGRAMLVQGNDEIGLRLRQLCDALTPGASRRDEVIEAYLPRVAIIRMDIECVSGKANNGADE